jgi:hypothetical protein
LAKPSVSISPDHEKITRRNPLFEYIFAWSSACLSLTSSDTRPNAHQNGPIAAQIQLVIDGLQVTALLQNAGESSWEVGASAIAARCEHVADNSLRDSSGSCTTHQGTATVVARTVGNVSRVSGGHSMLVLRNSLQAWRLLDQVRTMMMALHDVICHGCQWNMSGDSKVPPECAGGPIAPSGKRAVAPEAMHTALQQVHIKRPSPYVLSQLCCL